MKKVKKKEIDLVFKKELTATYSQLQSYVANHSTNGLL
jgi:hypothetical protein